MYSNIDIKNNDMKYAVLWFRWFFPGLYFEGTGFIPRSFVLALWWASGTATGFSPPSSVYPSHHSITVPFSFVYY